MSDQICNTCGVLKPIADFPVWGGVAQPRCKACQSQYNQQARAARKASKAAAPATGFSAVPVNPTSAQADEPTSAPVPVRESIAPQMTFHASKTLIDIFRGVVAGTEDGSPADNLMFLGPSGCGKTTSGQFLADLVKLPFIKIDAAAMTDPESWFGTREVIAVDGASVTTYRPSQFVEWIGKPCVMLIDEINRLRDEHRNIILPLTDGTHEVTNPLTGEVVTRHPQCFIIMSGNRGLQFTGTYAIDPALMTRAYILEFNYLPAEEETAVVLERYPTLDPKVASTLVRLANETRAKAAVDPDFIGVSTREVLQAAKLVRNGVDLDVAVAVAILNVASDEGGDDSIRASIKKLWTGVRPLAFGGEARV